MFRRFFDEGLAQSSYLIACARTRQAAVIDPRRDIDEYMETVRTHGLSLAFAIETHIHADFVSGARELAAHGVATLTGPGASLGYPAREMEDGAPLQLGDVGLTFLHTPGHTPEHVSILARVPGSPVRVFTGDTLFVGAVGRPDLLGKETTGALASQLHDSLFRRLLALEDDVEVHPGHGAGSLCGAGIRAEPHTTIGRERLFNPLLQHHDKDRFVRAVLDDLPESPPYFSRMKRVNREGPPLLGLQDGVAAPPAIDVARAVSAVASGAWLIDVRSSALFAAGHPAGAINMTYGAKLGYWAGWIIPAGAAIVLVLDGGVRQAVEVRRQLLRVGLDRVDGWVEGGFDAWRAEAPVRTTTAIAAAQLRALAPDALVIDVRSRREWDAGHISGAVHIPLGDLPACLGELPRDRTVATICEGGYRSSLAASLIERHGIAPVLNVADGMAAWRLLEARA